MDPTYPNLPKGCACDCGKPTEINQQNTPLVTGQAQMPESPMNTATSAGSSPGKVLGE